MEDKERDELSPVRLQGRAQTACVRRGEGWRGMSYSRRLDNESACIAYPDVRHSNGATEI